jgi:hypothetical protein
LVEAIKERGKHIATGIDRDGYRVKKMLVLPAGMAGTGERKNPDEGAGKSHES